MENNDKENTMPRKTAGELAVEEYRKKVAKAVADAVANHPTELCIESVRDFCKEIGIDPPTRKVDVTVMVAVSLTVDSPLGIEEDGWHPSAFDEAFSKAVDDCGAFEEFFEDVLEGVKDISNPSVIYVQVDGLDAEEVGE